MFALAAGMCAQAPRLDDPQRSVFRAFPAANAYRVIVRDVDAAARKLVEDRLPFRVHYDELGAHSLYVAMRDARPVGMIYVQYEEGTSGLAAVEWAISFDMRVQSFHFQRMRSASRASLVRSPFVRLLNGCSAAQLVSMLDENGQLRDGTRGVTGGTEQLAGAVVRSGVKTFALLGSVWRADVAVLHDQSVGMRLFPTARRFDRLWPNATGSAQDTPASPAGEGARADKPLRAIDRVRWAVRASGPQRREHGVAVRLHLGNERDDDSGATAATDVMLVVDARGSVRRVEASPDLPARLRMRCRAVRGQSLAELAAACERDELGQAIRGVVEMLDAAAEVR